MDKNMPPPGPGFIDPGAPPPPVYSPPAGYGVPPPSYGVDPPPQQPSVVVLGSQNYGCDPQRMSCPFCHANILTRVETESNMKTHLFALLLFAIGFWCCSPCPYCVDSCLVKNHYCPSCKAYLGRMNN
ncbi:lipopolysaccharide-induced tumor necrosis factor-alpha factor homolog [Nomia melanderi]|uniref:lipopolysaccharide-induced tumor necrosis factor-alpha factor homolog n=1 Tax=Nomia melanderi TaxID=2448451 RepID=UPI0013046D7B|nr:lipopolysaccharide-induced tumor necrosis factor-alpha factor homolog [Nomia melanderi]XP_031828353.1 lipopolysaccharide-induced tumor necrosis factor-alpha factor homolog [Nomia melanderi]